MSFHHESGFAPHDLTSDTSHSPFVVSASSALSGFPEWQAFDGVTGTGGTWLGTGHGVDYLQLDGGAGYSKKISTYSVRVNSVPEPNRAPKTWTLKGSTDGTTFTDVLDTRTNETAWGSGETRNYTPNNANAVNSYRAFRLDITANNGDGTYTQINELYLYYDDVNYVDNYNTVITTNSISLDNLVTMMSQSFTPQYAYSLVTVGFKLNKVGSPAGNITCYLKTDSGTYGTSSVPTTPVLSTSATVAASSLGTAYDWVYFTFPADYTMPLSPLSLVLYYPSGTATDYIVAQYDYGPGTASGNWAIYTGGAWVTIATRDFYYYVGGNAPAGNFSGMMV